MINKDALRWFKETFGRELAEAATGTPFSIDLLVAIAAQETGEIWAPLRNKLPVAELLAICVGDTLDANKGRVAFPKTRDLLEAEPRGGEMFIERLLLGEEQFDFFRTNAAIHFAEFLKPGDFMLQLSLHGLAGARDNLRGLALGDVLRLVKQVGQQFIAPLGLFEQ